MIMSSPQALNIDRCSRAEFIRTSLEKKHVEALLQPGASEQFEQPRHVLMPTQSTDLIGFKKGLNASHASFDPNHRLTT